MVAYTNIMLTINVVITIAIATVLCVTFAIVIVIVIVILSLSFIWMSPTVTEEHREVVFYQMKADTRTEGHGMIPNNRKYKLQLRKC